MAQTGYILLLIGGGVGQEVYLLTHAPFRIVYSVCPLR